VKAVRTIVPMLVFLALVPTILFVLPSDAGVRVAFFGLLFAVSGMAGHELASFVSLKAAILGGVITWAGIGAAFAAGFGSGAGTQAEFLGRFSILVMGVGVPLLMLLEKLRRRREM